MALIRFLYFISCLLKLHSLSTPWSAVAKSSQDPLCESERTPNHPKAVILIICRHSMFINHASTSPESLCVIVHVDMRNVEPSESPKATEPSGYNTCITICLYDLHGKNLYLTSRYVGVHTIKVISTPSHAGLPPNYRVRRLECCMVGHTPELNWIEVEKTLQIGHK